MKNLTTTRFTDASSETKYSDLEKEMMLFAEVQGKNNGTENKPLFIPEFKALFLNTVESRLQGAIYDNQREYLPISGMVVAQKNQADAGETIKPLTASLRDKDLQHRKLEQCKKECTPDLRKRNIRRLVYLGASIIAIAEGFFAYEALRRVPLAKIPAFMTSLGITVALAFGTHILAGYIRKAKNRLQFILRFCISVIPVFIGFYVLGHLRAQGYTTAAQMNLDMHHEAAAQPGVSGIGITILSFLLFLAALIFSIRYHKTEEEEELEKQYDKACRELIHCEKKMMEIKTAIEKTKGNANSQSAEALKRYEYALSMENRLKALGKQVVEEYILKNLCYRSDGLIPLFFSEPPTFHFQLFFDNLKKDR